MHNCLFVFCFAIAFFSLCVTGLSQSTLLNFSTHNYKTLVARYHQNLQNKTYNTFKKQNTENSSSKKKYPPNRTCAPCSPAAKLNLLDAKEQPFLCKIYQKILIMLYQHQFNLIDLKQIASLTIKNLPKGGLLESITLRDKKLQKVWYKILKGTKDHESGYPSLLHYCTVNPLQKKGINFNQAHSYVLEALFNKKLAARIIEQEKILSRALQKKELVTLCHNEHILIEPLEKSLQFHNSSCKKEKIDTALPLT